MPDVLSALITFVAEHRRCGDLDGGLDCGKARVLLWGRARALARGARGPGSAGSWTWRG
jgi:hypothetical protein